MTRRHTAKEVAARPGEVGATAVEYSLILAGIAAVIVAAVAALGTTVAALYQTIPGGV